MVKKYFSFLGVFSIFCLTLLLITSCSENDCSITNRPAARFVFMDSDTREEATLSDTLTVRALHTDSILLNRIRAVSYISLPLSYTDTITTFIFEYHRGLTYTYRDTIEITHTNIPYFISMECGRDMFFHINSQEPTFHILDELILTNPDIRDHEKENFQIFYTPYE